MPTGKRLTLKQRAEIMEVYKTGNLTQSEIASLVDLGISTVSRVIAQEQGFKPMPEPRKLKTKFKTTVSIAATNADHAKVAAYAKLHDLAMHNALHIMLSDSAHTNLINTIQREVEIMVSAAKTEVAIIKKKWWHL